MAGNLPINVLRRPDFCLFNAWSKGNPVNSITSEDREKINATLAFWEVVFHDASAPPCGPFDLSSGWPDLLLIRIQPDNWTSRWAQLSTVRRNKWMAMGVDTLFRGSAWRDILHRLRRIHTVELPLKHLIRQDPEDGGFYAVIPNAGPVSRPHECCHCLLHQFHEKGQLGPLYFKEPAIDIELWSPKATEDAPPLRRATHPASLCSFHWHWVLTGKSPTTRQAFVLDLIRRSVMPSAWGLAHAMVVVSWLRGSLCAPMASPHPLLNGSTALGRNIPSGQNFGPIGQGRPLPKASRQESASSASQSPKSAQQSGNEPEWQAIVDHLDHERLQGEGIAPLPEPQMVLPQNGPQVQPQNGPQVQPQTQPQQQGQDSEGENSAESSDHVNGAGNMTPNTEDSVEANGKDQAIDTALHIHSASIPAAAGSSAQPPASPKSETPKVNGVQGDVPEEAAPEKLSAKAQGKQRAVQQQSPSPAEIPHATAPAPPTGHPDAAPYAGPSNWASRRPPNTTSCRRRAGVNGVPPKGHHRSYSEEARRSRPSGLSGSRRVSLGQLRPGAACVRSFWAAQRQRDALNPRTAPKSRQPE